MNKTITVELIRNVRVFKDGGKIKHLKFNNDFSTFLKKLEVKSWTGGCITFLEQTSEIALLMIVYEPYT